MKTENVYYQSKRVHRDHALPESFGFVGVDGAEFCGEDYLPRKHFASLVLFYRRLAGDRSAFCNIKRVIERSYEQISKEEFEQLVTAWLEISVNSVPKLLWGE